MTTPTTSTTDPPTSAHRHIAHAAPEPKEEASAVAQPRARDPFAERLEARTCEIGLELFQLIGRGPGPLERAYWDNVLMDQTLGDPVVKVQLFRFTDALPSLRSPESIRRHLYEYLAEAGDRVPWFMKLGLGLVPPGVLGDRLLAQAARVGATSMARRFIAGSTPDEALRTILRNRRHNLAFTADLLGEAVVTEAEADAYLNTCLDLLRGMAAQLDREPERPIIDRDHQGPIPRLNLSVKLTGLTSRFDPVAVEATTNRVMDRLRPLARQAMRLGAFLHLDVEHYAIKDLTYSIFKTLLSEPEFRGYPHFGIVSQAYLRDAERDLIDLNTFIADRGVPVTIRLVKGAYWDYEVVHARAMDWPIPVWTEKWRSDACFERCARYLVDHHDRLRPAFGSHNLRSLAHGLAYAELRGLDPRAVETQVLHGMGEPIARALVAMGRRVRMYTPYGAMLPGMAYLVRRLLENTSNESFLKASFVDHADQRELLRDPEEVGAMFWNRKRAQSNGNGRGVVNPASNAESPASWPPFTNEPLTDFTRVEAREHLKQALERVEAKLGVEVPVWIGGQSRTEGDWFDSLDPGDLSRVVARARKGTVAEASEAVAAAHAAFGAWAATPVVERATILRRAAALMRRDRAELTAWIIYESAKPWKEADADVAEAIDFCEFYAREMVRLAHPRRRDVPGEENELVRMARGVAVVIPPWNFPLAIPVGMTAAALVAGDPVVLKPSENAPAMAWHLCRVFREAGLPEGVLNLVPGFGEVGAALVADPRVALIAFTGSKAVGLSINETAARTPAGQHHVKRVIAEMGGKNAIIVDDDADLDEATLGVLHSAFGFAGQKCSACSRVIVLADVYDTFVKRLADAVGSLPIAPATDPDCVVNPLIDRKAFDRVTGYQARAASQGRIVAHVPVPETLRNKGHYVGPLIVADVDPQAPIAQEEIFGPVLAVIKARDLDDALAIANGVEYALTGGLYSRSPAHIERVRREFLVGNLYINRPITGALVDRQPFGGAKLSGIGTKAGGPDYLLEFTLAKSITENTLRRGFAPEVEAADHETDPAQLETASKPNSNLSPTPLGVGS